MSHILIKNCFWLTGLLNPILFASRLIFLYLSHGIFRVLNVRYFLKSALRRVVLELLKPRAPENVRCTPIVTSTSCSITRRFGLAIYACSTFTTIDCRHTAHPVYTLWPRHRPHRQPSLLVDLSMYCTWNSPPSTGILMAKPHTKPILSAVALVQQCSTYQQPPTKTCRTRIVDVLRYTVTSSLPNRGSVTKLSRFIVGGCITQRI